MQQRMRLRLQLVFLVDSLSSYRLIAGEVLGPVLAPGLGGMDMLSGLPLEGLGAVGGDLFSGLPLSDAIEGVPSPTGTTINGAIIANAASADASGERAYAASNALCCWP